MSKSTYAEDMAMAEELAKRAKLEDMKVEFPPNLRLGSHDNALVKAAEFIQKSVEASGSQETHKNLTIALSIITCVRGEIQKLARINPYYLDSLDASLDEWISGGVQSEMEL